MSGHSKWSTIKHKKGAADAKRGKIFSRLSKDITLAAKNGGGDPDMNPKLRTVLLKARSENMPVENTERAIKKGTGELPGVVYEEFVYEGYAPHGVAVVIEVTTDNKNRAASDVRSTFSKNGGNLAGAGAVAFMFHRTGQIIISKEKTDEDTLMEVALEAGAEDLKVEDEYFEVLAPLADFDHVSQALAKAEIEPDNAELAYLPENLIAITEASDAKQILRLIDLLDDLDDVQNVFHNADIPTEFINEE
ncbi:MAG: YebC/PmpR family DNA-binding transcriptional regulator [Opitutales bacterium]|jgi:YebC/PmpR family DNA-binding regulatory protein|nr:YebC/PmpR family DNA-binding transcriptional regulator [Opitutales bacterium]MBT5168670.1 YebC/PmpR family DNA-binding transcriptional regulator [Opitutales bacterium]MBT5815660.1 YebC/PmpR family DNA-binding transcriptional regulator [Opitutales bacterium]MBT6380452.1 YebC/PmpR family DNA-binding transcriptional regulator [Opitutales bacterium]MBT7866032.1 YebC/PmpR family DNA-binding transcriptional regulator [Opitutales bacterium]